MKHFLQFLDSLDGIQKLVWYSVPHRIEISLKTFMIITSTLQGSQELGEPTGNSSDNVTTVTILRQQERELQNKIFFEPNFPALGIGDLVDGVLRHPHDRLDHLLRDRLLIS